MRATGIVAAIDCGTNSTRLLVAGPEKAALVREMRITRLGQGVDEARTLRADAMERTFQVLREFRATMDTWGVTRARLISTSAVRDAANGDTFLRSASEIVGVPAELLSGVEEGTLSYAGATADLPPGPSRAVVVDIGGGSTEIATPVHGAVAAISLDIGCVRVTERFLRGDPPSAGEIAAAVKAIDHELQRAAEAIPLLAAETARARLIGLAGTVSTLVSLELGLAEYDRDLVHHAVLAFDTVTKWNGILGAERVEERARRPGLPEGRRDVILGGGLVLEEVMRRFGFGECLVSESDILDGLVLSMEPAFQ